MARQYKIHLNGLVQGIGFRPFVYRVATQMKLNGYVENSCNGVDVIIEANEETRNTFISRIKDESPQAATIESVVCDKIKQQKLPVGFLISASRTAGDPTTSISPDLAVCDSCMQDITKQPHRIGYPFVNCTQCGPRFSIITSLPYDREATTMSRFEMCGECEQEYRHIADRRFHAQPIACNHCGPEYVAYAKKRKITRYDRILSAAAKALQEGKIVALKSMGGYSLLCDAHNEEAVLRLREMKDRPTKPLAVMFSSADAVRKSCLVSAQEEEWITSWRRPIVLLPLRTKFAPYIHDGYSTLGCFLPYMPIHYHLFEKTGFQSLVCTSGNKGGEAVIANDDIAREKLYDHVDVFIAHNREIHNRVDDSVIHCVHRDVQVIRRARGYVPQPLKNDDVPGGILAFGAEQISSFAFTLNHQIIGNQYIGNLQNEENIDFYTESLSHFLSLYRVSPQAIVCDCHPNYRSAELAQQFSHTHDLPIYRVQHHYAHAMAVVLEHKIKDPVLALCLDGTGYGDDGNIWGGEVLLCNENGYFRLDHFRYVPMPGGDCAVREPWRMAVSHCLASGYSKDDLPIGFVNSIGHEKINVVCRMIEKQVHSPYTSGAGRLFDAVAALLGICKYNHYSGEACNLLEHKAKQVKEGYEINLADPFDFSPLFYHLLHDIKSGKSVNEISGKFHYTVAHILSVILLHYSKTSGIKKIVLGGGVFQNKRLTELLYNKLKLSGIQLYISHKIPVNDAAIAFGQVAAVSQMLKNG